MNADDLVTLNEEIASMARAGLPLDQGLSAIAKDLASGNLKQVTEALALDLRAGFSLPEALQRQQGRLPPFYGGLVAAGIRTGRVHEVLATLTIYARSIANVRAIIIDALFYPTVVFILAAGVTILAITFILPQFAKIFSDFHMKLPALTQGVLLLSERPLEYFLIPFVSLLGGFILVRIGLSQSDRGRRTWARMIYALPVLGTMLRSARLAAFTDLLAILIDHETPLPEAFRLAGLSSSDPVIAEATQQIHQDLNQGAPLGYAMRKGGLVPEWVAWSVGHGERHGKLALSLHQIADIYRRQVEVRAVLFRTVLPPFLVIFLLGWVSVLTLALFLPLIKLLEGLSK